MHGHEITGWAIDTDVSGDVSPFNAPELGRWLSDPESFDAVVAYRLDRFARRVIPLNALFGWCQDHGKTLASVSESIDLSTWVGRLVANVIAGVAEGELEAIQERTQGSQKKLRQQGRWHGGTVPYGYLTVQRDGGYYFEIDPERAETVQEIAQRAIEGQSIRSIAEWLNDQGIPSPRGSRWSSTGLTRMLRSRWIIGQTEHKGSLVYDDDGTPMQFAPGIISYKSWKRVQESLDQNQTQKKRPLGVWQLRDIARCHSCDYPLYYLASYDRPNQAYARCGARTRRVRDCHAVAVRAKDLMGIVEGELMDRIGDKPRKKQVYVPGTDSSGELDRIRSAIETVRKEKDMGLYDGDEDSYLDRMKTLVDKRTELELREDTPSGYIYQDTGETYREAWRRMDSSERRDMLLESGIIIWAEGRPFTYRIYVPDELEEGIDSAR